jgi:hypothetical protein
MTRIREELVADRFDARPRDLPRFPPARSNFRSSAASAAKPVMSQMKYRRELRKPSNGGNPFVCEKCERDLEEAAHAGG